MPTIRDLIHKATRPKNSTNFIGAESFRTRNPYILGCYEQDTYSSIYPSVKAIANEFMKIRPKAIGANGESRDNVPALNALYHPNQLDSSVSFFEKIAVMNLTHRNTYLLVWRRERNEARPGGDITRDNIIGYTFLENPGLEVIDGRTYYNMGAQKFSDKEVIVLTGGVDPYGLYNGYAPGIASKKWATLDDYIAEFNKGHLENGAVPAGQFVITASTPQDYNDTVDKLQEAHRGASKTNNVTYTPRPVDPTTGKPGESKIEWIPFGQTNKENDFKTLFEQANNRIDSTFGVPASIRGVGESNNYATARIDQQNFIRFTIEPLALRIYTQITHELNRITGGLGVAITFELQYPAIADEEKVQAETKQVEVNTILTLTDRGFSLDTVVDALKLSNAYKTLTIGDFKTTIENDKPDVDEGNEVEYSPNPNKIDGINPLNKAKMQVSSREFPDLYSGLDVDLSDLGCIMVDVDKLNVLKVVGSGSSADLATDITMDRTNIPAEEAPHITLLYGLLENGNVWKDKVDTVLKDWSIDKVKIKEISYFNLEESYAIIAHIEETTDLIEGHDRLTLLPHINTFSEYRPHMTLAYIKKEADLGKWLTALNADYQGKELTVSGINYGDLPEVESNPKNEAAKSKNPKAKLTEEQQLEVVAERYMKRQIDRVIAELDEEATASNEVLPDPEEDEIGLFATEAYAIIVGVLLAQGLISYSEALAAASATGIDTAGLSQYFVSEATQDRYLGYLRNVGTSYGNDTADSIRGVLADANANSLTRRELESNLRNILNTDEYRVKRLSVTEVNHSTSIAKIDAYQQMADLTGSSWEKALYHRDTPEDEYCLATIDVYKPIDQPYLAYGETLVGTDGGLLVNDFVDNPGYGVHSNCRGVPVFRRTQT